MSNADSELKQFIYQALLEKIPRSDIEQALTDAGWRADQIQDALNEYAANDFPVPVPRPKPYLSAKETFLYLILFTALILTATNFGQLIFELIDRWLPDPARQLAGHHSDRTMQWNIAIIVITYPLYLIINYFIQRGIRIDPGKRSSKIRKWLTYLTLFIAAGFFIGDMTTLVYRLLAGDVTLRFILKFLTVALIAVIIFGYYITDLRKDEKDNPV